MNENIIKGVQACREAISNEQAKIAKMEAILLDLKKKYQLQCKKCKQASNIEDFKSLTTNHYRNGDWSCSGFYDNHLVCPKCGVHNRVHNHHQRDELFSVIGQNPYNIFKQTGSIDYDDHHPWV